MDNRNTQPGQSAGSTNRLETPGHGPQGIDKAPGEEASQDNVRFVQEALKGKKVDRDITDEKDEPLRNQEL